MKKVGLFFGSYNPIHVGHLIIANHLLDFTDLEQVWMVVSPQNPFKEKKNLLNQYDRLHLVELATDDNPGIIPSDIEFNLPIPSYTIDTLTYLKEKHENVEFNLIMGGDNLAGFEKWKNPELILRDHEIFVYSRPGQGEISQEYIDHPKIHFLDAPMIHVSASYIRELIKSGKCAKYLLTEPVYDYIDEMNIYK